MDQAVVVDGTTPCARVWLARLGDVVAEAWPEELPPELPELTGTSMAKETVCSTACSPTKMGSMSPVKRVSHGHVPNLSLIHI